MAETTDLKQTTDVDELSLTQIITLLQTVATLTKRQREVFLFRYVDGLTYKEIAKRLNISISRVGKVAKHSRRMFYLRLREKFEGERLIN